MRKRFKNPLTTKKGEAAAWHLFVELGRPFDSFEIFAGILRLAIIRKPSLYRQITVPKKSGGKRTILIPCQTLKHVQRLINRKILEKEKRHPNTFGFSGGNVQQALEIIAQSKQPVFSCDVRNAFPNTNGKTVFNIFKGLGYGFNKAYYLTCLTTWYVDKKKQPRVFGLPQGAPTSPRLFDLAFLPFDKKLASLAQRVKGNYVRYADNIFFTAPTFWPKRVKSLKVAGETRYFDDWGTECWKPYKIKKQKFVEGAEDYIKEDNTTIWFAPLISAIYSTLQKGYEKTPKIKWTSRKIEFCAEQKYSLHKAYLARAGSIVRALGLNIIDGQIHNRRIYKRRIRMLIYNLQKAMAQKESFEEKVWPLYQQLEGVMNFAIQETLPQKLVEAWESLDYEIYCIRYSNGYLERNITEY